MKNDKKVGIWMDHTNAFVIEYDSNNIETKGTETKNTFDGDKDTHVNHSENQAHNREQHQQADFYKKLTETIKNYDEVLLFGPTDAKKELYNKLKDDHHFENIKIEVQSASHHMSENQQHAFVRDYFSKSN